MVFCQRNTLLHRSSTANVNGEGDRVLVLLCFCCVSIRVLLCTVLWASCAVSPAAMYVLCQHPVLCQHQSKCCYALCSVSSIWDCHSNGALTADSADCTVHCTRMNCSTHSSLSHSISFTALHNLHNMHGLVHCSTATVHCWLNGLQCSAGGSSQCTALQWRRQLVRLRGKELHSVHIVQCRRRQAMPMEWWQWDKAKARRLHSANHSTLHSSQCSKLSCTVQTTPHSTVQWTKLHSASHSVLHRLRHSALN